MSLPNGATCVTCMFWDLAAWARKRDGEMRMGQCRRMPPRVLTAPHITTRFPMLREDEWCGEHAIVEPAA